MKEVTKKKFKELYFQYGGGAPSGWSAHYWNMCFEQEKTPAMKYLAQEPETLGHTRMMIVTDYGTREYRMFFLREEAEEHFFDFPAQR